MQDDDILVSSRHNPEWQQAGFLEAVEEPLQEGEYAIRSLDASDTDAIRRIDRHLTGRDRREYLEQKIDEALNQSGIRVSLVAESDGLVVGFIMARLDHGEFGRMSTTAVIDNIGVDPGYRGAGSALLAQLFANLGSLRVDGVRTIVRWDDIDLIRFLSKAGFQPVPRLVLRCKL